MPDHLVAVVDGSEPVALPRGGDGPDVASARLADRDGQVEVVDGSLRINRATKAAGPSVVLIPRR